MHFRSIEIQSAAIEIVRLFLYLHLRSPSQSASYCAAASVCVNNSYWLIMAHSSGTELQFVTLCSDMHVSISVSSNYCYLYAGLKIAKSTGKLGKTSKWKENQTMYKLQHLHYGGNLISISEHLYLYRLDTLHFKPAAVGCLKLLANCVAICV